MGRFLTKDPFPGYSSLPSTLNPYSYALNNPANLVDPSGQNPLLILAAVSFLAGVGVNTWMQYQANHGWCGFDLLAALEWGISAAVISTLAALSVLQAGALLGMGLQGIAVLFNWLPAFSVGSNLSAAVGAATVWFMTGKLTSPPSGKTVPTPNSSKPKLLNPRSRGNVYHYDRLNGSQGAYGPSQIQDLYPETEFYFAPRGASGPDVVVFRGIHPSKYPASTWPAGFNYADFKPYTSTGIKKFYLDLNSGKFPIDTTPLYYEPETLTLINGN